MCSGTGEQTSNIHLWFCFVQWDGTVGRWQYFDYWAHEGEEGERRFDELDNDDDNDGWVILQISSWIIVYLCMYYHE